MKSTKFFSLLFAICLIVCALNASGCNQSSSRSRSVPVSGNNGGNNNPPAGPTDNFAESQGDAVELLLGTTVTGQIDHTHDQDWYKVWINAGETVAVVATGSTGIWLQSSNDIKHGLTAQLLLSRSSDGYAHFFIEDETYTATPSYDLSVTLVPNAPAPPPVQNPLTITRTFTYTTWRDVGAGTSESVIALTLVANEDVKIVGAGFEFSTAMAAAWVSLYNTYTSDSGIGSITQPLPYTTQVSPVGSNTEILTLRQGEEARLQLFADLSGRDNVFLSTYLRWIDLVRADGSSQRVYLFMSDTVRIEALPDVSHLRPAATVAQVQSGTSMAEIGEFESRNLSQVHTADLIQVDVARLTDGDNDPLSIVDLSGFLLAQGYDYTGSVWDGSNWVPQQRVVFFIPAGYLRMAPNNNVRWRLMADTSNAQLADTEYSVEMLVSRNDNDQALPVSGFHDNTGSWIRFRLERR